MYLYIQEEKRLKHAKNELGRKRRINRNEYEHVKKYFEGSDIKSYLFRTVLKSVRFKIEGWSAREANGWVATHELLGHVRDGTQNNREYEQAKKEQAT